MCRFLSDPEELTASSPAHQLCSHPILPEVSATINEPNAHHHH